MENGLVSKILKFAFIPLIAFSLNTNKIHSQEPLFEFNIDAVVEGGPRKYNHEITTYGGWEKNFQPLCWDPYYGDNSLNSSAYDTGANFEAGLSLKLKLGDYFSIGPRLGLNFPSSGIGRVTLNWWDLVRVKEVYITRSPSIGVSANVDLFDHWVLLNGEYSKHHYEISEQKYRGVDVVGGKNYSVPLGNIEKIYEGDGDKVSASIYIGDPKNNLYFGLGFFTSTDGKDVSDYGLKCGVIYRIPITKINPLQP